MTNNMFFSCLKATELVEKKQIAGLSCKEKLQLGLHKAMCGACKNYERQSLFIDVLLYEREKDHQQPHINPLELQQRIKKRLAK